jgi:hypothetical protein
MSGGAGDASPLARVQRMLERTYRVTTSLDVDVFMVDERARDQAVSHGGPGTERRPREQLLLHGNEDELRIGLFVDEAALANLRRNDPALGLSEGNFGDFCLAVEGVSHFVYVAMCASMDRRVTALELELQAEVDKFVTCLLLHETPAYNAAALRYRLFHDVRLADDLGEDERDRYRTAHDAGHTYAESLERRFMQGDKTVGKTGDMLDELRRFYRMALHAKLGHIAQAA